MNVYRYVRNRPVFLLDPLGLRSSCALIIVLQYSGNLQDRHTIETADGKITIAGNIDFKRAADEFIAHKSFQEKYGPDRYVKVEVNEVTSGKLDGRGGCGFDALRATLHNKLREKVEQCPCYDRIVVIGHGFPGGKSGKGPGGIVWPSSIRSSWPASGNADNGDHNLGGFYLSGRATPGTVTLEEALLIPGYMTGIEGVDLLGCSTKEMAAVIFKEWRIPDGDGVVGGIPFSEVPVKVSGCEGDIFFFTRPGFQPIRPTGNTRVFGQPTIPQFYLEKQWPDEIFLRVPGDTSDFPVDPNYP